MKIKREATEDTNEGDGGGVGVERMISHKISQFGQPNNLQFFLEEKLSQEKLAEMQGKYQEDILFKEQIDSEYCNSELERKLEEQGREAYDFLSQIFVQEEKILPKHEKQKLWQRINKNI